MIFSYIFLLNIFPWSVTLSNLHLTYNLLASTAFRGVKHQVICLTESISHLTMDIRFFRSCFLKICHDYLYLFWSIFLKACSDKVGLSSLKLDQKLKLNYNVTGGCSKKTINGAHTIVCKSKRLLYIYDWLSDFRLSDWSLNSFYYIWLISTPDNLLY